MARHGAAIEGLAVEIVGLDVGGEQGLIDAVINRNERPIGGYEIVARVRRGLDADVVSVGLEWDLWSVRSLRPVIATCAPSWA